MNQAITPEVIQDARNWLLDCGCPPDLVDTASDRRVMQEVELQYDGGWAGFMEDGDYPVVTFVQPLVVFG